MATITKEIGLSASEIIVDCRNAQFPIVKNTLWYAYRYVVNTDYTAADNLVLKFVGAQKILYFNAKEVLASTNTNLNAVENGAITNPQGMQVTTAATNASSLAVEIFAIVEV